MAKMRDKILKIVSLYPEGVTYNEIQHLVMYGFGVAIKPSHIQLEVHQKNIIRVGSRDCAISKERCRIYAINKNKVYGGSNDDFN